MTNDDLVRRDQALENALTMTGCKDEADLIGMANVGQSLMEAIEAVTKIDPLKGWMPADNPAEIVVDLTNMLTDAIERGAAQGQDWRDMAGSPKDGTLLRLLVKPDDEAHTSFEDSKEPYETIGFNQLQDTGDDVWQFAGWDWSHDCITQGYGEVIGWLPFSATPSAPAPVAGQEIEIDGRTYRKFISPDEDVDDGTVRCIACGQIDEEPYHDPALCPACPTPQASAASCMDCELDYGDPKFCDLIIDHETWRKIAPDDGLLCPNCLIGRLRAHGLETSGKFTSGPLAAPVAGGGQ